MPKAMYLHIPFCEHICHYCDFNKVFLKGQPVDEYLAALEREMKNVTRVHSNHRLETIFIGGGTPTSLSAKQLRRLFTAVGNHFTVNEDELEYTVEVNPGSVDEHKLEAMALAGVNRLSIGVQSFDNAVLEAIGRTHDKTEVLRTLKLAREYGFNNISIDLMFGLPKQSLAIFRDSIKQAIDLDIEHVSAYSLKVEAKTVFYNLQRKGKLVLPSEEDEVRMYEVLLEELDTGGFVQYEISNFAKEGFQSKHNLTYWDNESYFGIGAGAHGYINGTRYENASVLPKYLNLVERTGNPIASEHVVTKQEMIEEEMFMGLRKIKGVAKRKFFEKYNIELEVLFKDQIEDLTSKQLLIDNGQAIALTKKGLLLGNEVFEQFLGINHSI